MSNQALPQRSRQLLDYHADKCQNLGLMLDKYAPWQSTRRGQWDLVIKETVRRRGQDNIQELSGGQAKGLWLSTRREAKRSESPSLFEVPRTDTKLMVAKQARWRKLVQDGDGHAFSMRLVERLIAGLGASHVLETGFTLDRNTGLPYLPGSTVKGLARAWGLIEVAAQLNLSVNDLNPLAKLLIENELTQVIHELERKGIPVSDDARPYIGWFQLIFGSQKQGGAVAFLDAIYYGYGSKQDAPPRYVTDVMTPHYVDYYTQNGGAAPSDSDDPNPVSFLTVDSGNVFAFGVLPRAGAFVNMQAEDVEIAMGTAVDWLQRGLSRLGAGSKTAAGYGFFSRKSVNESILTD